MWVSEERVIAPSQHIVLSPHYDDAALSCGGLLALLAAHGRHPRVAIIFGAEPDPGAPLTDFASFQHQRWGLPPGAVIAGRQREEAAAMAILGAETVILPFSDAIYRGDSYTTESSLFSPPVAIEAALPGEIARALNLPSPPRATTRIYVPLALGGHVDHRLTHDAGLLLVQDGWDVWFYEDMPYALLADPNLLTAHSAGEREEPLLIDITATWQKKVAAILEYPSQNPVIFRQVAPNGGAREIERALAAYALRIGGGERRAERYWSRMST